jgi:hypothetical protein
VSPELRTVSFLLSFAFLAPIILVDIYYVPDQILVVVRTVRITRITFCDACSPESTAKVAKAAAHDSFNRFYNTIEGIDGTHPWRVC